MKVLVLSNVSGGVDDVVSLLESQHGVTAKEASAMTSHELADAAGEQLASGTYAMVVLVAKDPVAVSLALNKMESVTAVVCNSQEEALLAKRNNANAIVVKDMEREQLDEVLSLAIAGSGVLRRIGTIAKAPQPRIREQHAARQVPEPKAQKAFAQEHARKQEEEEEEQRVPSQQQRAGFMGKLKDYLGIV